MPRLPREILDMIIDFVKPDPFRAKAMANSMCFIEDSPTNLLWRSMFKDERWFEKATELEAEPVLIGASLGDIIASQRRKTKPAYIILHANDNSGDLFRDGIEFLRQSLRSDHRYDREHHEVIFPAMGWWNASGEKIKLPKIVLNVRDIVLSNPFLYLEAKRARRLIANGDHQTSFCFLRGPKIQSLKSCDTIGIGGAISSKDGLTPVCTLNLQGTIKTWQVTIHDPTREDFHPVFERGKYGVLTFLIIGWEYY
ncbi:uncharacterized protein N7469_002182 [Penicillium citrinum]|uniref:F-box domain-containing protein n=1 Tax=Penicillium citrinum TaxID=5077 RepID=A0A9W9TTB5_PENCI|nr:uncharacterized protein N7469_002182 [Penicillium citrinum]KAJ5240591.1 hypothetical protein N7469_002182 [Penicillium citrinum]